MKWVAGDHWHNTTGDTETPATGNLSRVWSVYNIDSIYYTYSLNNGLRTSENSISILIPQIRMMFVWLKDEQLPGDGWSSCHSAPLSLSSPVLRHIDCFCLTFNGIAFGHTITPSNHHISPPPASTVGSIAEEKGTFLPLFCHLWSEMTLNSSFI